MRSTSASTFESDDLSKNARSPSEANDCIKSPNKIIATSVLDIALTSDNNLSLPSSAYLEGYPNAAVWNNASIVESVAPGCRLEPQSITFLSTVLNTCKALLGAGIVALPMIFAEASLIPGIIIFTLVVMFSSCSFWLIGYLSHKTTHKSWGGMWKAIISHSRCNLPHWVKTGAPIDLMIILANICNGCSYTLIATANLVNVMQDWFELEIPALAAEHSKAMAQSQWDIENPVSYRRRQYTTIILTLFFLIPLNFVNLRKVSFVSVLGILATALLVAAVAFCGPTYMHMDSDNITDDNRPKLWNPTLQTIGCFAQFSIACCAHSISPNFYQALESRTPSRFAKTTSCGYIVILAMNLIVGICGYLRFGNNVQANILEAYSSRGSDLSFIDALFINIARICISLSVLVNHSFQSRAFSTAIGNVAPRWLFSYECCMPIDNEAQIIKNKQNEIKIIKILSRSVMTPNGTSPRMVVHKATVNPQENEKSQLMVRILYTFVVLLISLWVKRLKILFKLTGALISSSLVYTTPGIMLLMMGLLYKSKDKEKQWKFRIMVVCGIIFILMGLLCTVFGLYTFIMYTK